MNYENEPLDFSFFSNESYFYTVFFFFLLIHIVFLFFYFSLFFCSTFYLLSRTKQGLENTMTSPSQQVSCCSLRLHVRLTQSMACQHLGLHSAKRQTSRGHGTVFRTWGSVVTCRKNIERDKMKRGAGDRVTVMVVVIGLVTCPLATTATRHRNADIKDKVVALCIWEVLVTYQWQHACIS